MIICLISGFLGSGKTTLMIELGKRLGASGRRAAIIVNEVGEVGVDGAFINASGLKSVELTEGCICCSLSGSLQNTLRSITTEYKPDVILIEPTGLALPTRIERIIRTSMIEHDGIFGIGVVDAYRGLKLEQEATLFFRRQLEEVNVLAVNKVELVSEAQLQELEALLQTVEPKAEIVRMSARNGTGVDELEKLLEARLNV
ncbi:MAG: GTP-binding protein [Methanomassiliicoccales archaeon]